MAKKRKPPEPAEPVDLSFIAEGLRPLATPIGDLVPDPANAMKHPDENIEAIKASLRNYGQRKPIVVNKRNMTVEAGNGTLQAALALGWSHVAVVLVDDEPTIAAGFAIADNRTAQLAKWDKQALDQLLRTLNTGDEDLGKMFDDLAQEFHLVPGEDKKKDVAFDANQADRFQVLITCKDETQQLELLERFEKEGIECKPLTV